MTSYCSCCCGIDKASPLPHLCHLCYLLVDSSLNPQMLQTLILAGGEQIPIASIFCYQYVIRSLVLKGKMGSSRQSARLLLNLIFAYLPDDFFDDVLALCPAPASMKSRLRGKFNLASFWAYNIASIWDLPLLSWKGEHFFTWYKRSTMNASLRRSLAAEISVVEGYAPSSGQGKILIVDDVITSGYTIGSIIRTHPGHEFKALTLATALKKV